MALDLGRHRLTIEDLIASPTVAEVGATLARGLCFEREGESDLMRMLATELGVSGQPDVLEPSEFDAYPGHVLCRGVSIPDWAESYVSGGYRATYGLSGEGVYTVGDGDPERSARVAREFGKHVIRLKWKQDAYVGEIEELSEDSEAYLNLVKAQVNAIPGLAVERKLGVERLLDDVGCFAIIAGFDGWYSEAMAVDGQNVKYHVVANRLATLVRQDAYEA